MRLALPINRLLGERGTNILTRVVGLILAAMSVQFVVDAVRAIVKTME